MCVLHTHKDSPVRERYAYNAQHCAWHVVVGARQVRVIVIAIIQVTPEGELQSPFLPTLEKCTCYPGPEAVSLTFLQYLLAGSFSSVILLLPSHPQMPTFSSRPKVNVNFSLYYASSHFYVDVHFLLWVPTPPCLYM